MAKAISMSMSIPGVEVWINYNAANRRIPTVEWTLPQPGIVARARIWNSGALIYDRTIAGPASGTENIPGNHTMVQKVEFGETILDLPDYITWQMNIETIGGG